MSNLSEIGTPRRTEAALKKRKIFTTEDLAAFVPRKYRDYREVSMIQSVPVGSYGAFEGTLKKWERKTKGRRDYMSGIVEQDDGTPIRVLYFSRMYQYPDLVRLYGLPVVVCGKTAYDPKWGWSVSEPDEMTAALEYIPKIQPVYSKIGGVSEAMRTRLTEQALDRTSDPLEEEVRDRYNLPGYQESLYGLHFPESPESVKNGRRRLMTDDLVYFSMILQMNAAAAGKSKCVFKPAGPLTRQFIDSLPYHLTGDQEAAIRTFADKAASGDRADYLLQGDVGCGKTVVAVALMVQAAESGYQSVLMAPRQVLAAQHFEEVSRFAKDLRLTAVFLHSGMKTSEKKKVLEEIRTGKAQLIVGTHSCLADSVEYADLGLAITDEEHLFGVQQKEALKKKAEEGIHRLSMSATPIPRSIASVLYGDATDVISIKEKPAGRKPILTKALTDRTEAFRKMEEEIRAGHQCYAVCPAIDENEETDIRSIEELETVYKGYFAKRGIRVGVVHGRMDKADAARAIDDFVAMKTKVLLSTTVIEVGVNVPNATMMVVEQADRFGLASLHQLRGRVGRSSFQSYCYLLSDTPDNERLDIMTKTNDGFVIAEADLKFRGAGDLIGTEQSGQNKLIGEMLSHPKMYAQAKEIASWCLEKGYGQELIRRHEEHDSYLDS